MKVLIAELDVFSNVGGGQTAYQNLVGFHPEIQFYFYSSGAAALNLPKNVSSIPYIPCFDFSSFTDGKHSLIHNAIVLASNLAVSAQGNQFDVVDSADYHFYTPFLRSAFQKYNVEVGRYFLALHGDMSTTVKMNWPGHRSFDNDVEQMQELERLAYQSADLRYGLSSRYLKMKKTSFPELKTSYLSPLLFFKPFPLIEEFDEINKDVELNFIGRQEKRKGPDLFIDLIWELESKYTTQVSLIGAESSSWDGINSNVYLVNYVKNRFKNAKFKKSMAHGALWEIFKRRSITFLPSRFDSFNLLAIESLFSGCPTVIGSGAGVCDYLDQEFPGVPYLKVDIENSFDSANKIRDLITHYTRYRKNLLRSLTKIKPFSDSVTLKYSQLVLDKQSDSIAVECEKANELYLSFYPHLTQVSKLFRLKKCLSRYAKTSRLLRTAFKTVKFLIFFLRHVPYLKVQIKMFLKSRLPEIYSQLYRLRKLKRNLLASRKLDESSNEDLLIKISSLWDLSDFHRLGRNQIYLELSRLERKAGQLMNACTYDLRSFRMNGKASPQQLSELKRDLSSLGLMNEAQVVELMYEGKYSEKEVSDRILRHLNQTQQRLSHQPIENKDSDFEIFDNRRRPDAKPKVSIIVSLYNAESKIALFLKKILAQTLMASHELELVFVDSHSPTQEYRIFCEHFTNLKYPVIYARTHQRETIQEAWNRGIQLAQGDYLSFLGVDESVKVDACELLAQYLDTHPAVDWIMSNSLITEVDPAGNHLRDSMLYDREGYSQKMHYLECCYLSYVGGMYRKTVHTQVGYYDSSFKGAGDTEFKNRVLRSIQSAYYDATLGLFLNYPDDRTTASARVEIEDLRAWYLYRTPGGIRYTFNDDPDKLADAFWSALSYRKSYKKELSSDAEYAFNILKVLLWHDPKHELKRFYGPLEIILDGFRSLDNPSSTAAELPSLISALSTSYRMRRAANQIKKMGKFKNVCFEVLNDNRYEQHFWAWRR